jgi:hypothetical protein
LLHDEEVRSQLRDRQRNSSDFQVHLHLGRMSVGELGT